MQSAVNKKFDEAKLTRPGIDHLEENDIQESLDNLDMLLDNMRKGNEHKEKALL